MSDRDALLADVLRYERKVWDALVAGDAAGDVALLAADFLGVYPDGFADRSEHSGQLDNGPSVASYTISQPRIRAIGTDHALLSYHAAFTRPDHTTHETMFVSSLWQRRDAGWINLFSQDTPDMTPVTGGVP